MGRAAVNPVVAAAWAGWAVFLAAALGGPALLGRPEPGLDAMRTTVWLALAGWAVAAGLLLTGQSGPPTRALWAQALLAFVAHVRLAFRYYHHDTHAEALEHVRSVAGWGPGIYVSYAFTVVWAADAAWWLLEPASRSRRPAWVGRSLHAFMAFIIFNGTVVYESGPVRWAGVAAFALLAALLVRRLRGDAAGLEAPAKVRSP